MGELRVSQRAVTGFKARHAPDSPAGKLGSKLEALRDHGTTFNLAEFLKKTGFPKKEALNLINEHLKHEKKSNNVKSHHKVASVLAEFVGTLSADDAVDCVGHLIEAAPTEQMGQLILGMMIATAGADNLEFFQKLSKKYETALKKTTASFSEEMASVVMDDGRSMGVHVLEELIKFSKNSLPAFKDLAGKLVPELFGGKAGLSLVLTDLGKDVLNRLPDLDVLGKGPDSPWVVALTQHVQMGDLRECVNLLYDASSKGATLDAAGGPIEAYLERASKSGSNMSADVVAVALLSGSRKSEIFQLVQAKMPEIFVEGLLVHIDHMIAGNDVGMKATNSIIKGTDERLERIVGITDAEKTDLQDARAAHVQTRGLLAKEREDLVLLRKTLSPHVPRTLGTIPDELTGMGDNFSGVMSRRITPAKVIFGKQWTPPGVSLSAHLSKSLQDLIKELGLVGDRSSHGADKKERVAVLTIVVSQLPGLIAHLNSVDGDPLDYLQKLQSDLFSKVKGAHLHDGPHKDIGKIIDLVRKMVTDQMKANAQSAAISVGAEGKTLASLQSENRVSGALGTLQALKQHSPRKAVDEAVAILLLDRPRLNVLTGVAKELENFFDTNTEGAILCKDVEKYADGIIANYILDPALKREFKHELVVALNLLKAQFGAVGRVDVQQDAILRQLQATHAAGDMTFSLGDSVSNGKIFAEMKALYGKGLPPTVVKSLAIKTFVNTLRMANLGTEDGGVLNVKAWFDGKHMVEADRANVVLLLKELMSFLRQNPNTLVVSKSNGKEVSVLLDLLKVLHESAVEGGNGNHSVYSSVIQNYKDLLQQCENDSSGMESLPSTIGSIRSADLEGKALLAKLVSSRKRFDGIKDLYEQVVALESMGVRVDSFGADRLHGNANDPKIPVGGLGGVLQELGALLGLDKEVKGRGWGKTPGQFTPSELHRLDELMTVLDKLVGSSNGSIKHGVRLEAALDTVGGSANVPLQTLGDKSSALFSKSVASFELTWGKPFNFGTVHPSSVKSLEAFFVLKSEIETLQLQIEGQPTLKQAALVKELGEKVKELSERVSTLASAPRSKMDTGFAIQQSRYKLQLEKLEKLGGCPHLLEAIHASMAEKCIKEIDTKDGADNTAVMKTLQASLKQAPLADQKRLLVLLAQQKIAVSGLVDSAKGAVAPANLSVSQTSLDALLKSITTSYDACVAHVTTRFGDEVSSAARHMVLWGELRGQDAAFVPTNQAAVVGRLVALKGQQDAQLVSIASDLDTAKKPSVKTVMADTVTKMATQIMDAWMRAGDETIPEESPAFSFSLEGYGVKQTDVAKEIARGLTDIFSENGVPRAGVVISLTPQGLTISFEPGMDQDSRLLLVNDMKGRMTALVPTKDYSPNGTSDRFDEAKQVVNKYATSIVSGATHLNADYNANFTAEIGDLFGKIMRGDTTSKSIFLEYLKTNTPFDPAKNNKLTAVVTAIDRMMPGICSPQFFSSAEWTVIFQAMTPKAGGRDLAYAGGLDNIEFVLNGLANTDTEKNGIQLHAFLRQFLPDIELSEVVASINLGAPGINLLATQVLAATMKLPETMTELRDLLNTCEAKIHVGTQPELYKAIAKRVLTNKACLDMLFFGDVSGSVPLSPYTKEQWSDLIKELGTKEFGEIFNDKWTQAKRVQLATVLSVNPGTVLATIASLPKPLFVAPLPPPVVLEQPIANPVQPTVTAPLPANVAFHRSTSKINASKDSVGKLVGEYLPILKAYNLEKHIGPDGIYSLHHTGGESVPDGVLTFLGLQKSAEPYYYLCSSAPQPKAFKNSTEDHYDARLSIARKLLGVPGGGAAQYERACFLLGYKPNAQNAAEEDLGGKTLTPQQLQSAREVLRLSDIYGLSGTAGAHVWNSDSYSVAGLGSAPRLLRGDDFVHMEPDYALASAGPQVIKDRVSSTMNLSIEQRAPLEAFVWGAGLNGETLDLSKAHSDSSWDPHVFRYQELTHAELTLTDQALYVLRTRVDDSPLYVEATNMYGSAPAVVVGNTALYDNPIPSELSTFAALVPQGESLASGRAKHLRSAFFDLSREGLNTTDLQNICEKLNDFLSLDHSNKISVEEFEAALRGLDLILGEKTALAIALDVKVKQRIVGHFREFHDKYSSAQGLAYFSNFIAHFVKDTPESPSSSPVKAASQPAVTLPDVGLQLLGGRLNVNFSVGDFRSKYPVEDVRIEAFKGLANSINLVKYAGDKSDSEEWEKVLHVFREAGLQDPVKPEGAVYDNDNQVPPPRGSAYRRVMPTVGAQDAYEVPFPQNRAEGMGMRARLTNNVLPGSNPLATYAVAGSGSRDVTPPVPTSPRPNAVRENLLAPIEAGGRTPATESKFDSLRRILAKITSSLTSPDSDDIDAMNKLITTGTIGGINAMVKRGLEYTRIKALKGESTNTSQMEVVTNLMKALKGGLLKKTNASENLLELMQKSLTEELAEILELGVGAEKCDNLEEFSDILRRILGEGTYDNL